MPDPGSPWGARHAAARPGAEQRIYGRNACLAVFARRPAAIRKLWLVADRKHEFAQVMAWCARQRVGYRLVEREDLDRLCASQHHEGVCMAVERPAPLSLQAWLKGLADGPQVALWLDGVGNPHNFGAILRSAAHFGAAGVLVPQASGLAVSGAAARVAEGGAEQVPLVAVDAEAPSLAALEAAGFSAMATVVREGADVFAAELPVRLLLVMGAEGEGVSPAMAAACRHRIGIPGSGAVESLNVSAATAVFLSQWWQRHARG